MVNTIKRNEQEEHSIRFRDLSCPIQGAIIIAWSVGVIWMISFFIAI